MQEARRGGDNVARWVCGARRWRARRIGSHTHLPAAQRDSPMLLEVTSAGRSLTACRLLQQRRVGARSRQAGWAAAAGGAQLSWGAAAVHFALGALAGPAAAWVAPRCLEHSTTAASRSQRPVVAAELAARPRTRPKTPRQALSDPYCTYCIATKVRPCSQASDFTKNTVAGKRTMFCSKPLSVPPGCHATQKELRNATGKGAVGKILVRPVVLSR